MADPGQGAGKKEVSPRRRLGVALLLDPPVSLEVEGLRRALGDTSLGTVAPHVTLVPPVNVRAADLDNAIAVVRSAAAAQDGPLSVELGPVATFVPASPVVYLTVRGPDLDRLARLRSAVLAGPLLRPERWPWAPHVTLADEASPDDAEMAVAALRHYRSGAGFDRVVILEERDRRWAQLADACLGPPVVVGRGGLELEITEGRLLGPDALAMANTQCGGSEEDSHASSVAALAALFGSRPGSETIVLTGRREGRVAGAAAAWRSLQVGGPVNVCVLVEAEVRRQGIGRALVRALEDNVSRRGWATEAGRGYGPEAFFRNTGGWIGDVRQSCEPALPSCPGPGASRGEEPG
jgi:2'-5' RNA ligase/GNAT superfamily N-acetyltransferase